MVVTTLVSALLWLGLGIAGQKDDTMHDPIHFRPKEGRLADTIPYYHSGEYHIFYLRAIDKVPWEHIVSRDLVHWKELPTALVPDGAPNSADGLHMFTGSVIFYQGVTHIFYTGFNPANPDGREVIMQATSTDGVHFTKHPEDIIKPDGTHYLADHDRDFRDAYVFWNEDEARFWMLLCADDAKTKQMVVGVAKSSDLKHWEQAPPLPGVPGQECPDFFKIGKTYYCLGGSTYRSATSLNGPYKEPLSPVLDTPAIYAGKRMFDGKRHVWTGWLWDRSPAADDGQQQWGGTQCLPRELYAGPSGQLYARPVHEVEKVFSETIFDAASGPILAGLTSFEVPDTYMVQMRVRLARGADLRATFRGGYSLDVKPAAQEAGISGATFNYPRKIELDASKPVTIQAFVVGTMIECFIDDRFAFSCRGYDYAVPRLSLSVSGGNAQLEELKVMVPKALLPPPVPEEKPKKPKAEKPPKKGKK